MTARTPDGAGSGYFLRSHIDVRRVDTRLVYREAIRRAQESRGARTLDAGSYPVILEAQAVADLISGFSLNFDARSAEEGRSAFAGARRTDEGRREGVRRADQHPERSLARGPARLAGRGIRPAVAGRLSRSQRRAREPGPTAATGPSGRSAQPTPGPGQPHHPGQRPAGDRPGDDAVGRPGAAGDAVLVHPLGRSAHGDAHRPDARRRVVDRKGEDRLSRCGTCASTRA